MNPQCARSKLAFLHVEKQLRIDRLPQIPRLKMKMVPAASSRASSQPDQIAGLHVVAHFHLALTHVAVQRLDPVGMSYDNDMAELPVVPGHAHHTFESAHDGVAMFQIDIHAVVHPPMAGAETGVDGPAYRERMITGRGAEFKCGTLVPRPLDTFKNHIRVESTIEFESWDG